MDGAHLSITMLASGSSGNAAIVHFGSLTRRVVLLDVVCPSIRVAGWRECTPCAKKQYPQTAP